MRRRKHRPSASDRSDRAFAGFSGTDTHDLFDIADENLAVANLAGTRGLDDGLDGGIDTAVGHDQFDLHLGQEINDVFGNTVQAPLSWVKGDVKKLKIEVTGAPKREEAEQDINEQLIVEFYSR